MKCSGLLLRSSFPILAARARHLFSVAPMPAFSVAPRPSNSSDMVHSDISEASPCPLVAYRAHQVQSGATKPHLPRLLLKVASVAIPVDQWRERPDPPSCHNRAHNGKDFHGRAGRPKNNGYSESSPVTAVTAAEAGSVACCTSGRYGSTDGFPVTAETGGPYPSGTGLPAPNEADREGCVQIHELRSRTEASCPSQRAHRRIDGPDRSPACNR